VTRRGGSPFLTGKRLFARAAQGIPKGVICDRQGNVFAGCGDGVEIWNAGGVLLGVITVPGEKHTLLFLSRGAFLLTLPEIAPVSSLSWGKDGEIFICAEQTLWMLGFGDTPPDTGGP